MAGTHFNKRHKLGTLDKDVMSLVCLQLSYNQVHHSFYSAAFCQLVEGLFQLNMAESN